MSTRNVMLLITALLFALGAWWLWREWQKDRCSAGGGEWNYDASACGPRSG